MPTEISIDPQARRIETRLSGCVTEKTLHEYYRALYQHEHFDPSFSEIFDLTSVTEIKLAADELRSFSFTTAVNTCKGEPVRVAIVAPTELAFGLARMYELLQSESKNAIGVVRTRVEAEAWLESDAGEVGVLAIP